MEPYGLAYLPPPQLFGFIEPANNGSTQEQTNFRKNWEKCTRLLLICQNILESYTMFDFRLLSVKIILRTCKYSILTIHEHLCQQI